MSLLIDIKFYFYNSLLVLKDGKIEPVVKTHEYIDEKTNTKYYVYKNILSEAYSIEFNELEGYKITDFILDSEIEDFSRKDLDTRDMLNILARGIKQLSSLKSEEIKKTLEP